MTMPGHRLPASASSKSLLEDPTRLQAVFASFRPSTIQEDGEDGPDAVADTSPEELERQLHVSAQLGLALLERQEQLINDKKALQAKQKELEASISQLLDRLASSYKENAQVIKRAERAQANLDASEASNRQLLITLEDDRKTIRRLTAAQARHAARPNSTTLELADLRQELVAERQRADAAESRAARATSRLSANQSRLATISQQLERLQSECQERLSSSPVIRTSRSQNASSDSANDDDFRVLANRFQSENESMQADIRQLQELLQDSQDQVSHLQNQQFERNAFDESASAHTNFAADRSLANELPISPNLSRPSISPGLDDGPGRDWSSAYQTSNVMGRLPHTSNDSAASVSTNGNRLHGRRRSQQRTMPSASLRRLGGRAMSVDLTNMMQRKLEDLEFDYQAKATPPGGRSPISPQLRPLALTASVNSLSSSLGAPAYPSPHEDIQEAEESIQEGPTILEIGPSPIKPPYQGESGLSKSSPTKHRRDTISASMAPPLVAAKDASVQTEAPPSAGSLPSYTSSKPSYSQYTPSIMSSDAISEHSSFDHPPHLGHGQSSETLRSGSSRTAALGTLMEHVGKLLGRLKSADIVSLEARLKKQNLPGDVGYLAKSTMRDIVNEIEALRTHFRQVLDHEIAAAHRESSLHQNELSNESLLARKDFILLVKLFRDILFELGRLRAIVNRVGLEPQLASRLREIEGVQSPSDVLTANLVAGAGDKSAAASLLAPFSRLFSYGIDTTASPSAAADAKTGAAPTKAPTRAAPKLSASSALATATVNVEFGGQGGMRRQVSIMPQDGSGGLSARYQAGLSAGTAAPRSRQGMNRQISSIFAGGSAGAAVSSRQTATGNQATNRNRQSHYHMLSQNVDAVIDNPTNGGEEDDFRSNLLERTLRPRGLSDSSIHSTFLAHASPAGRLLTPAGLALSSTSPTVLLPEEADATVRATNAPARPSVLGVAGRDGMLRKISAGMKSYTGVASPDSQERESTPPPRESRASPSPAPSPQKSAKPAAPVALGRPSSAAGQHTGNPANAGGGSGLLAGLGAWATRAASYQETSHLAHRNASGSSRKNLGPEAEI